MTPLVFGAGVDWVKFAVIIVIGLVWLIRNLSTLIKNAKPPAPGRPEGGAAAEQLQSEIDKFLRQAQQQKDTRARPTPPPPPPAPAERQTIAQERIERKKRKAQERKRARGPQKEQRPESATQNKLSQRHAINDEVHRHLDTGKFNRHTAELSRLDDDSLSGTSNIHEAYDKRMAESDSRSEGGTTNIAANPRFARLLTADQIRNAVIFRRSCATRSRTKTTVVSKGETPRCLTAVSRAIISRKLLGKQRLASHTSRIGNMRFDCLSESRSRTSMIVRGLCLAIVALGLASFAAPTYARDAPEQTTAEVFKLPLPITATVKNSFLNALTRYVTQLPADGPPTTLVIEFTTKNDDAVRGSNFFECVQIAEFLTGPAMTRVRTVAYLPNKVKGHAVLVALASESIIMAPNAELGDAGIDDTPAEIKNREDEYLQIARSRRKLAPALALAMLDKSTTAYRVETDGGVIYAAQNELEELKKTKNILKQTEIEPRPLLLNGREARSNFGIAEYLADDRIGVEQALGVKLRENPNRFGNWKAMSLKIEGALSPAMLAERQNALQKAYHSGEANFALIQIDSDGGSPSDSIGFAEYLISLDPGRMRTVAWVSDKAVGDAAWIALGCDDLVMKPGATLGGDGNSAIDDDAMGPLVVKFRNIMDKSKKRNWTPGAAVIGLKKPVWTYKNVQTGRIAILGEDELREQPDPAAWKQGEKLLEAENRLSFDGRRGQELGLVELTPDNLPQLKEHYGLSDDPALKDPTWVDVFLARCVTP
ncbi:MAG: hypothetical protein QM811_13740 [Pirellulales bacterium]